MEPKYETKDLISKEGWKAIRAIIAIACILYIIYCVVFYVFVGSRSYVEDIKRIAPTEIDKRNWEILRYEGWTYGSFQNHGGNVWYHVRNKDNHNVQYRVRITMWDKELHYHYNAPEELSRVSVEYSE